MDLHTVASAPGEPDARPSVLALGWHAKSVEAFERHGYRVVSAIGIKDFAQARQHSSDEDLVVVTDAARLESVLAGLIRVGLGPDRFAAVWSLHELPIITASALAGLFDLPAIALGTAVALRDKSVQKRLARAAGLRVADCRAIRSLAELEQLPWQGPVVVKPFDDAASRDTFAVMSPEDLERILGDTGPGRDTGPWLVEEFMEGAELHVDGVVREGQVTFLSVSRYLQNVIAIKSGGLVGSVVLDPGTHRDQYAMAREVAETSLAAFGHHDGLFHLEVFQDESGLIFSECAGRIGGGMIRDVNSYQFGVDLIDEFARAVLGLPAAQRVVPGERRACGFVQLPAPAGRIIHLPTRQDIMARPGCVEARLAVTEGAEAPDLTAGSHLMAGKAMLVAADDDELEHRMADLVAWFQQTVVTSSEESR